MHLTISNQTHDDLICRFGTKQGGDHYLLVPSLSDSIPFSPKSTPIWFLGCSQDGSFKEPTAITESVTSVAIKLTMAPGRKWERVTLQGDSPWIIYRNRLSRKHHVLVVFPYRDTSCFLASIPDSVPLSCLMLPGTHETMAFYGWPISQCQYKPLDTQLHAGIRVTDIRLSIIDGRLIAYHGIFPEFTPFADILVTLHNFLTSPTTASETVVVSIKQEDWDTELFPQLVHDEIVASPGGLQMWFLENRIPNLGEVRGKAVMFSRFGSDGCTNGIHPPIWPDSAKEGFEWECDGTLVRTHDWYGIPSFLSIHEKFSLSMEILNPPNFPVPTLSISFTSASSIPLALPPVIARGFGWPKWGLGFEGVNHRVGKWLLSQLSSDNAIRLRESTNHEYQTRILMEAENAKVWHMDPDPRIRGWVLMDYYDDPIDAGIVPLLVECNFRGRMAGEEGW